MAEDLQFYIILVLYIPLSGIPLRRATTWQG